MGKATVFHPDMCWSYSELTEASRPWQTPRCTLVLLTDTFITIDAHTQVLSQNLLGLNPVKDMYLCISCIYLYLVIYCV